MLLGSTTTGMLAAKGTKTVSDTDFGEKPIKGTALYKYSFSKLPVFHFCHGLEFGLNWDLMCLFLTLFLRIRASESDGPDFDSSC